ncbi:hypothetical protein Scep_029925 [Stephania cephalantha]|uniref:Uncharacterized protein n=1 Tax=Stephania cephalantha TaxID=152367 RepID=A0AAP0E6C3_9MAGN
MLSGLRPFMQSMKRISDQASFPPINFIHSIVVLADTAAASPLRLLHRRFIYNAAISLERKPFFQRISGP